MTNLDTSKQIALKLSSLNDSDFNWVFSQLEQDVKNDLTPLLNEIKSIGIEIDTNLINTLVQNNATRQAGTQDTNINIINNSNFDDVVQVFKSEPTLILNTLINLENWDWKKDKSFINRTDVVITKTIKDIKSKKLLEKSIISNTAMYLNTRERKLNENEVAGFRIGGYLVNKINKLLRPNAKWKF